MTGLRPIVCAAGLFLLTVPALADCTDADAKVRAAIASGVRAAFQPALDRVIGAGDCSSAYRSRVRRVLSLAALKAIGKAAAATGKAPAVGDLEQAAGFAQTWQVMVSLGDAYYDTKDWAKAFRAYEAALGDMADETANPTPPPEAVERKAHKRAVQARLLAPVFVASRSVRGVPQGVSAMQFRTFSVSTVPVPVRFAYDKAELTEDGQAAAREILNFVTAQQAKGVRLIGHTDPVGSDGYNMQLSQARADALKAFLEQNGYGGTIEVIARGESEPFAADDPGKYTQDELYAMYRRVEYQLVQ